jgi:hypothetical protein
MVKRLCLLLFCALTVGSVVAQTTGGQLWVRAFEDRNGNGVLDPGEPLLTRGVNVNLIDANGIIIATALLDDSPNAARGLVGFQFLPPGQYTVSVTSAEFTPTTADSFTETVMESGVEAVHRFEYGAQRVGTTGAGTQAATTAVTDRDERITQIALAAGGAGVVMVLMVILGMIIFLMTLRTRLMAARAADARLTTGSMRRVSSTGEYRKS